MDKIIIETSGLTKVFSGGITAVDNVSFTVKEGEIFGFLGPNGAGKSTTIAMLTTLISPTKGSAIVAGMDISKQSYKVRLAIGYVSQDLAVDDALTGYANLRIQAGFYHIPGGATQAVAQTNRGWGQTNRYRWRGCSVVFSRWVSGRSG